DPSVSETIQVFISKAPTIIDAQSQPSYYIGGPAPLNVRVKATTNETFFPDGNVVVSENGVVLAERAASGATISLDKLPGGEHTFVLSYPGSDDYEPSTLSVKVTVLLPAFEITGTRVVEGNSGETTILCSVTLS